MKKILFFIFGVFIFSNSYSQTIPYGFLALHKLDFAEKNAFYRLDSEQIKMPKNKDNANNLKNMFLTFGIRNMWDIDSCGVLTYRINIITFLEELSKVDSITSDEIKILIGKPYQISLEDKKQPVYHYAIYKEDCKRLCWEAKLYFSANNTLCFVSVDGCEE